MQVLVLSFLTNFQTASKHGLWLYRFSQLFLKLGLLASNLFITYWMNNKSSEILEYKIWRKREFLWCLQGCEKILQSMTHLSYLLLHLKVLPVWWMVVLLCVLLRFNKVMHMCSLKSRTILKGYNKIQPHALHRPIPLYRGLSTFLAMSFDIYLHISFK